MLAGKALFMAYTTPQAETKRDKALILVLKDNGKIASDKGSQFANDAYGYCNVVARRFGHLKEYYRIATSYDKRAKNDLLMIKLGYIPLFYNKLCN